MNQLQESVAELRRAGNRLFARLSPLLGSGPLSENRICMRPDLEAVVSILRACVRRQLPAESDLKLLNQAIQVQSFSLTAERGKADAIRIAMWGQLSVIVYHLAYYSNCLADNPRLKAYEPIGACSRCDEVFLKRRTDQEFCSNACRSGAWAIEKGKAYFAEKARESRAVRSRKRQLSRSDSLKPSDHTKKAGVDLGVELSPKPIKKHRKARKA